MHEEQEQMKRGELYFNNYVDRDKNRRRIPVMVVSADAYNVSANFATCVRLVKRIEPPIRPTHVYIPRDALSGGEELSDCYALGETVGSVRKTAMEGPIGELTDASYMDKVCRAIGMQVGIAPMEWADAGNPSQCMAYRGRPSEQQPWYSVEMEQIHRAESAYMKKAGE